MTDLISGQDRDFEGGGGGWSCYSNPDSDSDHGDCQLGEERTEDSQHYYGRTSITHLRDCGWNDLHVKAIGRLAVAGSWDGVDTDVLQIKMKNKLKIGMKQVQT